MMRSVWVTLTHRELCSMPSVFCSLCATIPACKLLRLPSLLTLASVHTLARRPCCVWSQDQQFHTPSGAMLLLGDMSPLHHLDDASKSWNDPVLDHLNVCLRNELK